MLMWSDREAERLKRIPGDFVLKTDFSGVDPIVLGSARSR